MKKEYLSRSAKSFDEKSDTELIDFIFDHVPIPGEGPKAILDKRMKKSIQHLTEVIQKNNTNTEKYNITLSRLTKWILWLTAIITIATIISILKG